MERPNSLFNDNKALAWRSRGSYLDGETLMSKRLIELTGAADIFALYDVSSVTEPLMEDW